MQKNITNLVLAVNSDKGSIVYFNGKDITLSEKGCELRTVISDAQPDSLEKYLKDFDGEIYEHEVIYAKMKMRTTHNRDAIIRENALKWSKKNMSMLPVAETDAALNIANSKIDIFLADDPMQAQKTKSAMNITLNVAFNQFKSAFAKNFEDIFTRVFAKNFEGITTDNWDPSPYNKATFMDVTKFLVEEFSKFSEAYAQIIDEISLSMKKANSVHEISESTQPLFLWKTQTRFHKLLEEIREFGEKMSKDDLHYENILDAMRMKALQDNKRS